MPTTGSTHIYSMYLLLLHSEVSSWLPFSEVCALGLWARLFSEEPEYHITKMKHKWIFAQFIIELPLHRPLASELFAVFEFDNLITPHFQFNNNYWLFYMYTWWCYLVNDGPGVIRQFRSLIITHSHLENPARGDQSRPCVNGWTFGPPHPC